MDPYRPDDPDRAVSCDICGENVPQATIQLTAGGARACSECAWRARKPVKQADFSQSPEAPGQAAAPMVVVPGAKEWPSAVARDVELPSVGFAKGFLLAATVYGLAAIFLSDFGQPRLQLGVAGMTEVFIVLFTLIPRADRPSVGFRAGLQVFGVLLAAVVGIILLT